MQYDECVIVGPAPLTCYTSTNKQSRHQRRETTNKYLFLVTIVGVFLLLMVDEHARR